MLGTHSKSQVAIGGRVLCNYTSLILFNRACDDYYTHHTLSYTVLAV